jgi:hypothetical protein
MLGGLESNETEHSKCGTTAQQRSTTHHDCQSKSLVLHWPLTSIARKDNSPKLSTKNLRVLIRSGPTVKHLVEQPSPMTIRVTIGVKTSFP